jgi:hypothetical protein
MLGEIRSILFVTIAVLGLGFGAPIAQATVNVVVDISSQSMTVEAEDAAVSYTWKVSTAKKGYRTPLGSFKPQWLARMHYSTLYDRSPMPYSIFFQRQLRHTRNRVCEAAG